MSAKTRMAAPITATTLALYEALVATQPAVERKGATVPYTSLNGNMFSYLSAGGLALRLPEAERERFMKTYRAKLAVSYATVMKEYVAVPETLLPKTSELRPWFAKSVAYARTLKAKPTTRAKPTGATRRS